MAARTYNTTSVTLAGGNICNCSEQIIPVRWRKVKMTLLKATEPSPSASLIFFSHSYKFWPHKNKKSDKERGMPWVADIESHYCKPVVQLKKKKKPSNLSAY